MSVLTDNLLERVAGIIPRYSMTTPGSRIGVAVSGGADSVVLLHILHRLSKALEIELIVLHVNHRLRGAESQGDEAFVRQLAESLEVPVLAEQVSIDRSSGNLEQTARLARREFFRRAGGQESLARIALGHTRSDQAETVLFRFLRGTGLRGFAGMRPVTADGLIRPLLTTSREEIRQWGQAEGIRWREDSSNASLRFTRNRLRHITLPALTREFNSNLETVLAATAGAAQAEEDYWSEQIGQVYEQLRQRSRWGPILDVRALAAFHIAVRRRVLRQALTEVRGDLHSIDMAHIESILAVCSSDHAHDRVIVPGVDALRSFGKLLLSAIGERETARHYRVDLPLGAATALPFDGGSVSLGWDARGTSDCVSFKKDPEIEESAELDADALASGGAESLFVRNWEPGDRLQRTGHSQPEKVKSLFQEYRIALWERRHWPVVLSGNEIVWVRRFGSAAKFGKSPWTSKVVRLNYRTNLLEK